MSPKIDFNLEMVPELPNYLDNADLQDILKRFTYHPPKENQLPRYNHLRTTARELATDILELVPPSRERSLALTNLEQAIMWANAAIARNE